MFGYFFRHQKGVDVDPYFHINFTILNLKVFLTLEDLQDDQGYLFHEARRRTLEGGNTYFGHDPMLTSCHITINELKIN